MIATRVSALALAAVLGVGAAAHGQTPPPQRQPGAMGYPEAGTWAPGSRLRQAEHEAAHLKALHDALNIRPDQEEAFRAFAAASTRPPGEERKPEEMGRERQEMAGMTTPERLDAMSRKMDEHMQRARERFQRHAAAVKALYAALSPEQRRTLDSLPGLTGHGDKGHGDMGMGHHGPMDEHHMGAGAAGEHE
jgi:hypothetical protein